MFFKKSPSRYERMLLRRRGRDDGSSSRNRNVPPQYEADDFLNREAP